MVMLKKIAVTSEWTWERTMREAITEPLYKALRTLAERKSAFEKYQRREKGRIEEERKERIDGAREQVIRRRRRRRVAKRASGEW